MVTGPGGTKGMGKLQRLQQTLGIMGQTPLLSGFAIQTGVIVVVDATLTSSI